MYFIYVRSKGTGYDINRFMGRLYVIILMHLVRHMRRAPYKSAASLMLNNMKDVKLNNVCHTKLKLPFFLPNRFRCLSFAGLN